MSGLFLAVVLFIDNSPERLDTDDLREYSNIFFDPRSLETYWNKGNDRATKTGYTFEAATWRGAFGNLSHFQWPWLNPLSFATADTAAKAAEQARLYLAGYEVSVEVVENNRITGPFSRTVERQLVLVSKNGKQEEFSAGRFAERYVIRNLYNGVPPVESAKQFRAECARAGLIVLPSAAWRRAHPLPTVHDEYPTAICTAVGGCGQPSELELIRRRLDALTAALAEERQSWDARKKKRANMETEAIRDFREREKMAEVADKEVACNPTGQHCVVVGTSYVVRDSNYIYGTWPPDATPVWPKSAPIVSPSPTVSCAVQHAESPEYDAVYHPEGWHRKPRCEGNMDKCVMGVADLNGRVAVWPNQVR